MDNKVRVPKDSSSKVDYEDEIEIIQQEPYSGNEEDKTRSQNKTELSKKEAQSQDATGYEPKAPFPEALKDTFKYKTEKDMYEIFSKCEVNIPLLIFLESVPRASKFLKELCTVRRKRRPEDTEKVVVSEQISAVF